ncbi:sialidase family protein [Streptomyces sp. NPDC051546]|uniref:sialidase family protein n=1 Tax=Streptomyces sp. NPDC051546 TaxID=3365655 RepID=UPI00378EA159
MEIPQLDSGSRPHLTVHNGQVHAAYFDASKNLKWTVYDGAHWSEPQPIYDNGTIACHSDWTPAIVSHQGRLHCFHVAGIDLGHGAHTNVLKWNSMGADGTWSTTTQVNGPSSIAETPAPAVLDGRLYLAFPGVRDLSGIYRLFVIRHDGASWSDDLYTREWITPSAPAMTVRNNQLFLFVRAVDDKIHGTYSSDGTLWIPLTVRGEWDTASAPALGVHDDRLYLAYRNKTDNTTRWSSMNNGAAWSATDSIPDTSRHALGLTEHYGQLHLLFW